MAKTQIAILNLAGALSTELASYFVRKQIVVVDPQNDSSTHAWTHILVKDIQDCTEIRNTYQTVENDIRIISLTAVNDLQQFMNSNGKLIFHEMWMRNSLGSFILDKFLQEYGGIALDDNYPTFKEKGSFIITNPFNTGEYLDRMVQSAYLDGISGLSIKTFFDHLVMYLTGLKTKGKLGMPIEVMYGYFEDVFGVQLHFFTKDLILEDVTSSLSSEISKQAEKYLLNIAVQSSDFFDFTLLREVNKTVITGLWTKDDRIQSENRGLLFSDLSAAAGITNYPTEGVTSFQINGDALNDLSDKVVLPASKMNSEFKTIVKGQKEEESFSQMISGSKAEDEIIQRIKGQMKEEEQVFRISGSKSFDVEKFAYRVSSGITEKEGGDNFLKIKSLKNDLPEAIKSRFAEFAKELNKSPRDLSSEEIDQFTQSEIPLIVKQTSQNIDSKTGESIGNENEKVLELKINGLNAENENLKTKIKTLLTEVKIVKEAKTQMAEIHNKAALAAAQVTVVQQSAANLDNLFKSQILEKMKVQKTLSEQETKKLVTLMEKEAQFIKESHDHEIQLKKNQIEMVQKDTFFIQEIEKLNRLVKAKELIATKTKEGFTKMVEQKEIDLANLNEKLSQANKIINNSLTQNQTQQIRDLEKQVSNYEKMIEIYKNKVMQKPVAKTDDELVKEENKRLLIISTQLKNQIEANKKDLTKSQERMIADAAAMNVLKMDKVKLEQQIKKFAQDARKEELASTSTINNDLELKKVQAQFENMEAQVRAGLGRQKELELKLQDALKNQKKEVVSEESSTKGKTAHLENNVRKLTQDLVESRNQMAEMKKESNKLRQDKIALQNQLDKMKKDAEKSKGAAPKPSGTPGKAA
jgi:hypothetical protein